MRSYVFVFLAVFLWGIHGPAGRYLALEGVSMPVVTVLRFWIGTLVIGLYLAVTRSFSREFLARYRQLLPIGVCGIALNSIVYHLGFNFISATAAMLIENLAPFFVLALAWLVDGERIGARRLSAALVGFAGLVLVVVGKGGVEGGGSGYLWGILLEVMAGVTFGYYTWASGRFLSRFQVQMPRGDVILNLLFHVFLIASVVMSPVFLFSWNYPSRPVHWAWVVELGVFQSGVAYLLWNKSIDVLRTSVTSLFFFLTVFFTVVNETLFLGFVPNAWVLGGSAFILGGVAVLMVRRIPWRMLAGAGLVLTVGLAWYARPQEWHEETRLLYHGIPTRLRFRMEDSAAARAATAEAWREFERLGHLFNAFDPGSALGRLNADSGKTRVRVPPEFPLLLSESRAVFEASGGAFDPTLWPVKRLWDQAREAQVPPADAQVSAAVAHVGLEKVTSHEPVTLEFSDPAVQFDFGGIVKGFAVDRVREILLRRGASAGLIACGGEISAFGDNDGNPWRIGIQDPKDMTRIWRTIEARGEVRASTSGNYRQPVVIDGKEFYHIFSPHTGMPVSTRVLGITSVVFGNGVSNAVLDALTTAGIVLGKDDARALAERFGVELVVLEEHGGAMRASVSPGLEARLH